VSNLRQIRSRTEESTTNSIVAQQTQIQMLNILYQSSPSAIVDFHWPNQPQQLTLAHDNTILRHFHQIPISRPHPESVPALAKLIAIRTQS
jgi:hypothetical protein